MQDSPHHGHTPQDLGSPEPGQPPHNFGFSLTTYFPFNAHFPPSAEMMSYPVIIHPPLPSLPVPVVVKATSDGGQTGGFMMPLVEPRMVSMNPRQGVLVPSPLEGVYTI